MRTTAEKWVVDGEGIEPSTIRLKVECSTTELPVQTNENGPLGAHVVD